MSLASAKKGLLVGSGVAPETRALLSRMTQQPSVQRRKLIDALVRGLIADGIWSRIDVFYMLAAHDRQAALLNWKSASFPLTGTGVTVVDRGAQGKTSESAFLSSTYLPASNNDMHIEAANDERAGPGRSVSFGIPDNNSYLVWNASVKTLRVGNRTKTITTPNSAVFFWGGSVLDASYMLVHVNEIEDIGSTNGTAQINPTGVFRINANEGASPNGMNGAGMTHFVSVGRSLTLQQTRALQIRVRAFLTAIGAS